MASKGLSNVVLFIAGNTSQPIPSKAFMSYDLVQGKASKKNNIFNILDVDPEKTAKEVWSESIAEIKSQEGIS